MKIMFFSAPWCGSCKKIKPFVAEICKARGIDLDVVDIEKRPDLADEYEISAMPTLIKVDENGLPVDEEKTGTMSREDFEKWIEI